MAIETKVNRLHEHMALMVAQEASIETTLAQLMNDVSDHSEVAEMFGEFHQISGDQRQALEARLHAVAGSMSIPGMAVSQFDAGTDYPVTRALQCAYVVFNQAIIGYTVLRSIALRFRDSHVAGEGSTGDLAKQHTDGYISAVHKIMGRLHDIVLWEMDREGTRCNCTCPSCGLGVCLCAVSNRVVLSDAWAEVGPIAGEGGIFVHAPKPGSAAAEAGIQEGDTIVAVDGRDIRKFSDLQTAVREHRSGDTLDLQVRRASGQLGDIAVVRP